MSAIWFQTLTPFLTAAALAVMPKCSKVRIAAQVGHLYMLGGLMT